jgi:glycyl-tRNA synthetase beta chain
LPRYSGDELPATKTGMVLALAERLDTITGLFGIGQPPTGSKDPFALRRAALGVLRIVIEKQLPLDLPACIEAAASNFSGLPKAAGLANTVRDFIFERLRTFYADQGIASDVFLAVDAVRPASPLEFDARIRAVSHFVSLPQAHALAAANKRVSNILQKSGVKAGTSVDAAKLTEAAERVLVESLQAVQARVDPLLKKSDFTPALAAMAELQQSVDAFFDKVMVNVDDPSIRDNRLALVQELRALFLRVADISLLQNV